MEQMTMADQRIEISRAALWKRSGVYIEVMPGQQEVALKAAMMGIASYNSDPTFLDPAANKEGPSPRGKATSKRAALANWPRSGSQRARILELMLSEPVRTRGMTRERIGYELGMSGDAVRPRVLELIAGGWLFETEHTRPSIHGNDSVVLLASQKAVEFKS